MSLRQQNKARAKATILEAASQLIAEHGVEHTTTREIAKHAGVSYQTLYNYFPTKGLLIQALMAEDIIAWSEEVDLVIKRYSGDLLTTLADINRIALDKFSSKMDLWREVAGVLFTQNISEQQLGSVIQVAHDRYYNLLSMAQGTGELAADVDLHLLAHTLFCLTDYAGIRYFFVEEPNSELLLANLQEQLGLVLGPYLRG